MSGMRITNHFIARYAERILGKQVPGTIGMSYRKIIMNDMSNRILNREKNIIKMFKNHNSAVKVPFNKTNEIVMQNQSLITIY